MNAHQQVVRLCTALQISPAAEAITTHWIPETRSTKSCPQLRCRSCLESFVPNASRPSSYSLPHIWLACRATIFHAPSFRIQVLV
jgi:hypothetical protein